MTIHIDRDLFGDPVREQPKKKTARAAIPLVALPEVRPSRIQRVVFGVARYLRRFVGDTMHMTAVKIVAGLLTTGALGGWWAQVNFDWMGWSQAQIGEWTTTIQPEE